MKGRPIDQLVYECMFPKPKQSDPQNFQALLQRHLIIEVRHEVNHFYGHIETLEAKYPGLDYTHPIHRIRLSRWTWHRRLFRAFDALRLTHAEITGLTKWEGTKWAKERYEREQGIIIRDTAGDGLPNWVPPDERPPARSQRSQSPTPAEAKEQADDLAEDDSDEELESVGEALNERLRERVALRNVSGDTSMPLDEEWETWFKNAIESGDIVGFSGSQSILTPEDISLPRMIAAARAGHWEEIPTFLHDMIRRSMETEQAPGAAQRPGQLQPASINPTSVPPPPGNSRTPFRPPMPFLSTARPANSTIYPRNRRTLSDLRLPATEHGTATVPPAEVRVQRTARPGA